MWPPSSEEVLLARTTIAIAFQRTIERSRRSSAGSPGSLRLALGRDRVHVRRGEAGDRAAAGQCCARSTTRARIWRARSGPSCSTTASTASSHSLVSAASMSAPAPFAIAVLERPSCVSETWSVRLNIPAALISAQIGTRAQPISPTVAGVSLRELDGVAGAPWARPLAGALDQLVVESDALADNPLGDPARRPLYVYRPPGVELDHPRPLPAGVRDPGLHRADRHVAVAHARSSRRWSSASTRCSPPAPAPTRSSCSSTRGPRAAARSSSTRRRRAATSTTCATRSCAFVDERYPDARRAATTAGLTGKSSGGYGAMVVPMLRPDVFGALASHAGDALFECCYLRTSRASRATLRDHFDGSYEVFFERLADGRPLRLRTLRQAVRGVRLRVRVLARTSTGPARRCCRSTSRPGRLIDDVWALWLEHDPVRMAHRHADALRSMRRIYLDAGRSDEYFLDLGAQAFAQELVEARRRRTRSSCSRASTAASPTATRGRSASS